MSRRAPLTLCAAVVLAGCGTEGTGASDQLSTPASPSSEAGDRGASPVAAGPDEPAATPYLFSDCRALQPGDAFDVEDLHCNTEDVQYYTLDCSVSTGIYVHIDRGAGDAIEGITGHTPRWLRAEPVGPYGRTPFAFQNCLEHE